MHPLKNYHCIPLWCEITSVWCENYGVKITTIQC